MSMPPAGWACGLLFRDVATLRAELCAAGVLGAVGGDGHGHG